MVFKRICQALLLCILGACGSTSDKESTETLDPTPTAIPNTPTPPSPPTPPSSPNWTSLGPDGGSVARLAMDPSNSNLIYAGLNAGGAYQSRDGGAHWTPISFGIPNMSVSSIQIRANSPKAVYLVAAKPDYPCGDADSSKLLKSVDDGKTWQRIPITIDGQSRCIKSIILDPLSPSTLYAWLGNLYGIEEFRPWRSVDGGKSWSRVNLPGQNTSGESRGILGVDPHTKGTLYLATSSDGFWKSTDSGQSWSLLARNLAAPGFWGSFFLDPWHPGTIYAELSVHAPPITSEDSGIFRSNDGGNSFQHVKSVDSFLGASFRENGAAHLYGKNIYNEDATSFDSRLFTSLDGGQNWTVGTLPVQDYDFHDLLEDPRQPGTLYLGTSGYGILKSSDQGQRWTESNQGIHGSAVERLVIHPTNPNLLFCLTEAQLTRSSNGGQSWTSIIRFEQSGFSEPHGFEVDPSDPSVIYLVRGGKLDKSPDGGQTWTRLDTLGQAERIVIHPAAPQTLYAMNSDGPISKSTDGGLHWRRLDTPDFWNVQTLHITPSDPQKLYYFAMGYDPSGDRLVWSTDGGETWQVRTDSYATNPLLVDLQDSNTLYGLKDGMTYPGGSTDPSVSMKSTDGGLSWQPLGSTNFCPTAQDSRRPNILYAAQYGEGIFRSEDRGKTWKKLTLTGLTNRQFSGLAFDSKNARLYTGTKGGGVFRSEVP